MNSHETTKTNPTESSNEWDALRAPRWPEDPEQYTEAELKADPSKRFHVNPADFPIFSMQAQRGPVWGDPLETLPLDETMGKYVAATADTIAVIAGEDDSYNKEKAPAADHVIYLDKSARPVSWLVNTFWDSFTDQKRPKHSYLAIDRIEWFSRTQTPVDNQQYIQDPDGSWRLATFNDMKVENVTREDLARIRALYIPGGIETEDVEEIMNTPTDLDGKNITIVDEVGRSGTTLKMAQYLVSQAIPEAASVNGYTFWNPGMQHHGSGETKMRGAPVWYDASTHVGRGIGDVNESFFAERYERHPNPKTRAQKFGAFVLGHFIDLSKEPGQRSRKLAQEIKTMRREWDANHILMAAPNHYNEDKWEARAKEQGVIFVEQDRHNPRANVPKNAYTKIMEDISSRAPVPPHTV